MYLNYNEAFIHTISPLYLHPHTTQSLHTHHQISYKRLHNYFVFTTYMIHAYKSMTLFFLFQTANTVYDKKCIHEQYKMIKYLKP